MTIVVRVTPPSVDSSTPPHRKRIVERFEALAADLSALPELRDREPPVAVKDYVEILRSALRSHFGATGAEGFAFVQDGEADGADSEDCVVLNGDDGLQYKVCIGPDGEYEVSVGHPGDWLTVPGGLSFPISLCTDGSADEGESTGVYLSIHEPLAEHACEYPLAVPGEVEVGALVGFAVRFGRSRTGFLSIEVLIQQQQQQQPPILALPQNTGFGVRFFQTGSLSGASDVTIRVTFVGDPPVISGKTWIEDPARATPPPPPLPAPGLLAVMPVRIAFGDAEALRDDYERSLEEEWDLRELWSTRAPLTRSKKRHRLFLGIDRMSQSPDLEEEMQKAIHALGGQLSQLWLRRAELCLTSPEEILEVAKPFAPEGDLVDTLRFVALGMHRWLTNVDGEIWSEEDIREAFGMFACGECNAFDAHGAPNGVNMFSFFELALLLHDHHDALDVAEIGGVEADFWRRMAITFAGAAEMFVHCYHMGEFYVCSYKAAHNLVRLDADGFATPRVLPRRAFRRGQKEAKFAEWEAAAAASSDADVPFSGLRQRFARLVLGAISDEFEDRIELLEGRTDLIRPKPPVGYLF